jgi:hypothetical protein
VPPGKQGLPHVPGGGAREGDQPFAAVLVEPLGLHLGPPAMLVLQPGARQQSAKTEIAGARGRQQQHPVRLFAVGVVPQPAVDADHRLDAGRARRLVELHHPEDVAGIGERQGRHAVGRGALDRIVDAHDPVRHRVLAV